MPKASKNGHFYESRIFKHNDSLSPSPFMAIGYSRSENPCSGKDEKVRENAVCQNRLKKTGEKKLRKHIVSKSS